MTFECQSYKFFQFFLICFKVIHNQFKLSTNVRYAIKSSNYTLSIENYVTLALKTFSHFILFWFWIVKRRRIRRMNVNFLFAYQCQSKNASYFHYSTRLLFYIETTFFFNVLCKCLNLFRLISCTIRLQSSRYSRKLIQRFHTRFKWLFNIINIIDVVLSSTQYARLQISKKYLTISIS